MISSKTYLITGASGFLGRAVVRRLKARGDIVRLGVSTRNTSRPNEHYCGLDGTRAEWHRAIEGCDGVYHFAWSTTPVSANLDPLGDLKTNLTGTVGLLDALREHPGVRLVFASSGGTVYGMPDTIPIPESQPIAPLGAYGAAKVAAEIYARVYFQQWNVDTRILRIGNLYGPGQNVNGNLGAATIFAARAVKGLDIDIWGDGSSIRDYVYIDDVTTACLRAMEIGRDSLGRHDAVFNIGSGSGISLNDIVEMLGSILNRRIKTNYHTARSFDVSTNVLDVRRAQQVLGWTPQVDFYRGLSLTAAWFQQTLAVST